ncbi:MAG: S8 family serine peptidase [Roseiflexaceae bacterium]|nr:S8 family serine peptidase [Roseiflexaceae bacterium]
MQAQEPSDGLSIPGGPISVEVDAQLQELSGPVEIVVRLSDAPLSEANGAGAKQRGANFNTDQQRAYGRGLNQKQDTLVAQVTALGGVETGRVTKALNAVIFRVDAAQVQAIAALPGVRSVRKVGTYELDLSDTVPYIGATAVQNTGVDGTGVKVAVLDSGIDYTHRNLGGAGTLAAYEAAYGTAPGDPKNISLDGLFPTAKVVAGFDFVGEAWPNGPRTEDADPIDYEGHGTHVADIIAGRSDDGSHKGVAPGASLVAVKVCSAVGSSCNGEALLLGIDYALDPNGDGDISDAVDVINMSLGSSYGQREDDLSEASANAVRFGVTVVASAGNSADRPYILGSPSSTPEVISVAQTQVPSALTFALKINSPAGIAGLYPNTETVDWAPIGGGFTGDVVYVGRGCIGDAYLADPAGKIALVDRGTCGISQKTRRASDAGATGVLVALIAPGDAVTFSNAGECPVPPDGTCKPTLIIIQSYGNLIKANLTAPVNVTVSPAASTQLVGSMVGSSSRGPSYSYNAIKPDIGAPGASISAIAGTGNGEEPFGGTSGAAPMVAGAAALLIQKYPARTPAEIKSLLMNTAETTIYTNPATQPGVLAPITRIGGGEVRVDRAADSSTAAWDAKDLTGSLSFGYHAITSIQNFKKEVLVRNYSATARTYTITPDFRYADDAASGAIEFKTPATITVPANGSKTFTVQLKVRAVNLPVWNLNGGPNGGNGALLQGVEFDGYLNLASGDETVHLAWQILPHKAAAVFSSRSSVSAGSSLTLRNTGATIGRVDVFSLTGTSPKIRKKLLPQPGDNYALIDLKAVGVRQAGSAIQFAINTYGERAHPNYPAEFDVYIDTNRDGTDDYVVYNGESGGFGVSGQNVVYVQQVGATTASAFFFADADLNSANIILTAPLSALGLTPSTQFDFSIYAFDNYFTGAQTDAVENMTYTVGTPKYTATGVPPAGIPIGIRSTVTIQAVTGGAVASPSQTGLLLMYRDAKAKAEAEIITVRK